MVCCLLGLARALPLALSRQAGLREHFGKYGELIDVALMRNKHTGQPRGFGFVKFKDATGADKVGGCVREASRQTG